MEDSTETKIRYIRTERNLRLAASDKYMLEDYPIAPELRTEMEGYRQALRDLMEDIDPDDFEWPELPV